MSGKPETSKEAVYRMYIEEGKSNKEIVTAMKGRIKALTVRDYIQEAIEVVKSRGEIPPMRAKPARKGGFAKLGATKALSPLHRVIGNRLNRHRETVENLRPQAFVEAHDYFVSVVVLRQMEVGDHDFTLGELQTIADILKLQLSKLTEPATGHLS